MADRTVVILIDLEGNVSIEASNFKGKDCHEYTAELEKMLGVVTQTDNKKEHYNIDKQAEKNVHKLRA